MSKSTVAIVLIGSSVVVSLFYLAPKGCQRIAIQAQKEVPELIPLPSGDEVLRVFCVRREANGTISFAPAPNLASPEECAKRKIAIA
jgi:hypothetical protein